MTPASIPATPRPAWVLVSSCLIVYGTLCAVSVIWLSNWGQRGPGLPAGYGATQRQAIGGAIGPRAGPPRVGPTWPPV